MWITELLLSYIVLFFTVMVVQGQFDQPRFDQPRDFLDVASDQRICPDGWTRESNFGTGICYRIYNESSTWEDARLKCRENLSFLLKVNNSLGYQVLAPLAGVDNPVLWTASYIQPESGRLVQDGLVPENIILHPESAIPWVPRVPDPGNGACGRIRGTQIPDTPNKRYDQSLHNCSDLLPFICVRELVKVQVIRDPPGCGGWYGDSYLNQCYLDRHLSIPYIQANGTIPNCMLPQPETDYEEQFFKEFLNVTQDTPGQLPQLFWLGWTMNSSGRVLWSNGSAYQPNQGGRDLQGLVRQQHAPGNNCSAVSYGQLGFEYMWVSCSLNIDLICQRPPLLTETKINFTVLSAAGTPERSRISGDRIFPVQINKVEIQSSCTFGNNFISGVPVVWMKDWVFISKNFTRKQFLQGLYWCEMWKRKPFERVKSNIVLAVHGDVLSYRCKLNLPYYFTVGNDTVNKFNLFGLEDWNLYNLPRIFNGSLADALGRVSGWGQDVILRLTRLELQGNSQIQSRTRTIAHFDAYITIPGRTLNSRLWDEHIGRLNLTKHLREIILNGTVLSIKNFPFNEGFDPDLQDDLPSIADSFEALPTNYCPDQMISMDGQTFRIASGPQGVTFNSWPWCPKNRLLFARAYCAGNFYTGLRWEIRSVEKCPVVKESDVTILLTELSQREVTSLSSYDIAMSVANLSRNASILVSTDIILIANIVENLVAQDTVDTQTGRLVCLTIDNVQTANTQELMAADKSDGSSSSFIKSLDSYTEKADLENRNTLRWTYMNLAVEMWDLRPGNIINGIRASRVDTEDPVNRVYPWFSNDSLVSVADSDDDDDDDDDNVEGIDIAIFLPPSLIENKVNAAPVGQAVRLSFIIQRQTVLFQRKTDSESNTSVNSRIISATLGDQPVENLSSDDRIRIVFYPINNQIQPGNKSAHRCVFWRATMNNNSGGWSDEGCTLVSKVDTDGHYECLCDHLTNFAVLVDYGGETSPLDNKILTIITIVGLSLSIIGLSLTILSFLLFRKLRKGRTQKTLFNLALALLSAWILFLIGIILGEKSLHKEVGCQIVAILLHYFLVAGFMWMLVEAVLQYLRFVKVLGTYMEHFMPKAIFVAWGVPLIPVIVVLAVDHQLYLRQDDITRFCWLDQYTSYFAFLLPVGLIIVVNTVVFIMIVWAITHRPKGLQSNQSRSKEARVSLQAGIACFILLGLTWIFGYLAIQDARVVFQYIFTILNSFHGFFIFLFFTLREKKVRQHWKSLCCKTKDDRKKTYISSELSSTRKLSNDVSSNITSGTVVSNGKFKRINSTGESVADDRKYSGQGDMFYVNDGHNKFKRIESDSPSVHVGEDDTTFSGEKGHVAYLNNGFSQ